jgi:hypothetical protein
MLFEMEVNENIESVAIERVKNMNPNNTLVMKFFPKLKVSVDKNLISLVFSISDNKDEIRELYRSIYGVGDFKNKGIAHSARHYEVEYVTQKEKNIVDTKIPNTQDNPLLLNLDEPDAINFETFDFYL